MSRTLPLEMRWRSGRYGWVSIIMLGIDDSWLAMVAKVVACGEIGATVNAATSGGGVKFHAGRNLGLSLPSAIRIPISRK